MQASNAWRPGKLSPVLVGLGFIVLGFVVGGIGEAYSAITGQPAAEFVRGGSWLVGSGFGIGALSRALGLS